jgi:creatinine amidohydrolase
MFDTIMYSDLGWMDIRKAIEEDYTVVLPIGSTEQHGPQLPICTDDYMAVKWAEESATMAKAQGNARVLVMPTIHYGYARHHMAFPGTVTLSFETLKNITFEVSDSVLSHGFRKMVILNVHGGNRFAVRAAAVDVAHKYARRDPIVYVRVVEDCDSDMNPLIHEVDQLSPLSQEASRRTMVHSGSLETAKILFLRPELVHMDRAQGVDVPYKDRGQEIFPYDMMTPKGAMGRPAEATAEAGRIMWQALVKHFADYLVRLSKLK